MIKKAVIIVLMFLLFLPLSLGETIGEPKELIYEGWESGLISSDWEVTGTNTYRTNVTSGSLPYFPNSGNYHLLMDSYSDGTYSANFLSTNFSISNMIIYMSFYVQDVGDESHYCPNSWTSSTVDGDCVGLTCNGTTWYNIFNLTDLSVDYSSNGKINISISHLANSLCGGLTNNSKIAFTQYDDWSYPGDGIAFDDINITYAEFFSEIYFDGDMTDDYARDIEFDSSGNFYVVGIINDAMAIKKFNSSGHEIISGWNKTFPLAYSKSEARAVKLDTSGNIYVGGKGYNLTGQDTVDWWIKKFDSSGTEIISGWNKTYSSLGTIDYLGVYDLETDSSGNLYAVGAGFDLQSGSSQTDWWIKKFDSSGTEDTLNWNKNYSASSYDIPYSVAIDSADNVYVGGIGYQLLGATYYDVWLKKFDSSGTEDTINWDKKIHYGISDYLYDLAIDSQDNIYAVGSRGYSASYDSRWLIKKFNDTGEEYSSSDGWDKVIYNPEGGKNFAYGVAIDNNDSVFVVGVSLDMSTDKSNEDAYFLKYYSNGTEFSHLESGLNITSKYDVGLSSDWIQSVAIDSKGTPWGVGTIDEIFTGTNDFWVRDLIWKDYDGDGDLVYTDCDDEDSTIYSPYDNFDIGSGDKLCQGTYYLNDTDLDGLLQFKKYTPDVSTQIKIPSDDNSQILVAEDQVPEGFYVEVTPYVEQPEIGYNPLNDTYMVVFRCRNTTSGNYGICIDLFNSTGNKTQNTKLYEVDGNRDLSLTYDSDNNRWLVLAGRENYDYIMKSHIFDELGNPLYLDTNAHTTSAEICNIDAAYNPDNKTFMAVFKNCPFENSSRTVSTITLNSTGVGTVTWPENHEEMLYPEFVSVAIDYNSVAKEWFVAYSDDDGKARVISVNVTNNKTGEAYLDLGRDKNRSIDIACSEKGICFAGGSSKGTSSSFGRYNPKNAAIINSSCDFIKNVSAGYLMEYNLTASIVADDEKQLFYYIFEENKTISGCPIIRVDTFDFSGNKINSSVILNKIGLCGFHNPASAYNPKNEDIFAIYSSGNVFGRIFDTEMQSESYEFSNVTIIGSGSGKGVSLENLMWVNISGLTIKNYSTGMDVSHLSSQITISNALLSENIKGLGIKNSKNARVFNTTLSDNSYGAYIESSTENLFYYNNFTGNLVYHAYADTSGNHFNTTIDDSGIEPRGNFWDDVSLLNIFDSDGDNYGDFGLDYPYDYTVSSMISQYVEDYGPITTKSNSLPTVQNVVLNSSSGSNYDYENLIAWAETSDSDSDEVTKIHNWKKNGRPLTVLNLAFDDEETDESFAGITDYSEYDNNGTLGNGNSARVPVWTSNGISGGAYKFDGEDDNIVIDNSDSLNVTDSFSIEAWVNQSAPVDTTTNFIVGKYDYSDNNRSFLLWTNQSGHPRFTVSSDGGTLSISYAKASSPITTGEWHHIVGTFDSTAGLKLYVDGVLVDSASSPGNVHVSEKPITIGATATGSSEFNGTIDEVKLYSTKLTSEQIVSQYNSGIANYSVIHNTQTTAGENWSVCITPNDGYEDGSKICTGNLTIQSNQPPTLENLTLNSSSGGNRTYEDLSVYYDVGDDENDPVFVTTNWKVNSVSLTVLNLGFNSEETDYTGEFLIDHSGYSNNATLGSGNPLKLPDWTSSGIIGGAYNFDGITSTISVEDSASLRINNSMTLEAWIKPRSIIGGDAVWNRIIAKYVNTTEDRSYMLGLDTSGTPRFVICENGTLDSCDYATASSPISLNNWHHIVATYDGSKMRLYVDGSQVASTTTSIGIYQSSIPISIGGPDFGTSYFNGTIDEVRIYNVSLTGDQIANIYSSGTPEYDIIDSSQTIAGENWSVCIIPSDLRSYGATTCSGELTILEVPNDPPVLENLTITASTINNWSRDDLFLHYDSYDPDGDDHTGIVNWYVNGQSWTMLNIPFDINESNTAGRYIKDYSGYENNGTLSNGTSYTAPSWTPHGISGGAYEFDGINDVIMIENSPSLNLDQSFSIEVWANQTSLISTTWNMIVAKYDYHTDNRSFVLGTNQSGVPRLTLCSDGTLGSCGYANGLAPLTLGQWNHIVATYDGSYSKLYVNGILQDTDLHTTGVHISDVPITLGATTWGASEFNGTIDGLKIYDRVLTPAQIINLYNSGIPNSSVMNSSETVRRQNWTACVTLSDSKEDSNTTCANITIAKSPCVEPYGGFVVLEDETLCEGTFQINDTGNGAILINSSDTSLICNGSLILGDATGMGIIIDANADNVTIEGCEVRNYSTGLFSEYHDGLLLENVVSDLNVLRGISLKYLSNSSVNNITVFNNGGGLYLESLENNLFNDIKLYDNTGFEGDLALTWSDSYDSSKSYQFTNLYFLNPQGHFENYTNISITDSLPTAPEYVYFKGVQSQTSLPQNSNSFNNKYVNITIVSAGTLDNITWFWTDSEVAGYDENVLDVWKYDSLWTDENATLDATSNSLTLTGFTPGSTYTILETPSCIEPYDDMLISTDTILCPGTYQINDTWGDGVIKVTGSNYSLICNNTKLVGVSGSAILSNSPLTNVTLVGCEITGYQYGISLASDANPVSEISISNMSIYGLSGYSVYSDGVNNLTLKDCRLNDTAQLFVNSGLVSGLLINRSEFSGDSLGAIFGYQDFIVDNSNFTGNQFEGLRVTNAFGGLIMDSQFTDNGGDGISSSSFYNLTIIDSVISGNSQQGIDVRDNTTLIRTTIRNNGQEGIFFFGDFINITDSNIAGNSQEGIFVPEWLSSSNIYITDSRIENNTYQGINFTNTENITLTRNTLRGNDLGIYIANPANKLTIQNLVVYNNSGPDVSLFSDSGSSADLFIVGMELLPDSGLYNDYLNLTIEDVFSSESFAFEWSAPPSNPPQSYEFFGNKTMNITAGSGATIDNLTIMWNQDEVGIANESEFEISVYDSSWSFLTASLNTVANFIELSSHVPGSGEKTYSLVEQVSNVFDPENNMVIDEDTILSNGTFNVPDPEGDGAIIIGADNVTLICNDTVLVGGGSGIGFNATGYNNITIIGCNVTNYNVAVDYVDLTNSQFINGSTYSNTGVGIQIIDSFAVTVTKLKTTNNPEGVSSENSTSTSLENINAGNNTKNIIIQDSIVSIDYAELYDSKQSLYLSRVSNPTSITAEGIYILPPSGAYINYTNISFSDNLPSTESYIISWDSAHTLPENYSSFANKHLNISHITGNPSIDSITWHWLESELGTSDETLFGLWKYNGSWTTEIADLDIVKNTLNVSPLVPSSTYSILENLTLPIPCTIINSDITGSNFANTTDYSRVCWVENSTVTYSNISNSVIINSDINHSELLDSYVLNSTINYSSLEFSEVVLSDFCGAFSLFTAGIRGGSLESGSILFKGTNYFAPALLLDICAENVTPYDPTPPTAPTVYDGESGDDVDWFNTPGTLKAHWGDAEEDISTIYYKYLVMINGTDCLEGDCNFTSVGAEENVTVTGLALSQLDNYSFVVIAYNSYGLESENASSDGQVLDTADPEAPTIWSDSHPDQSVSYTNSSVILTWNSTDSESGIYGYSYILDGSASTLPDSVIDLPTYSDGENHTKQYYNIPDGQYWFHVRARDVAGNFGSVSRYNITIYSGGTAVDIVNPIDGQAFINDTINVSVQTAEKANVSIVLQYENGSSYQSEWVIVNGTNTFNDVELSEGINTMYAISVASANNITTYSRYVRVVYRPEVFVNKTLVVRYSQSGSGSRAPYMVFGQNGAYSFAIATENSEAIPQQNPMQITSDTSEHSIKLVFTSSDMDLNDVENRLEDDELLDHPNPSFGFKKDLNDYLIATHIVYPFIDIEVPAEVGPGKYALKIRNNGPREDGDWNITIGLY